MYSIIDDIFNEKLKKKMFKNDNNLIDYIQYVDGDRILLVYQKKSHKIIPFLGKEPNLSIPLIEK